MEGKLKEVVINIALVLISSAIGFGSAWLIIKKPEQITKCEEVEAKVQGFFKQPVSEGEERTATSKKGEYVASINGEKYYIDGEGYSGRISEENKIYFDSKEEAEMAGYEAGSGVD